MSLGSKAATKLGQSLGVSAGTPKKVGIKTMDMIPEDRAPRKSTSDIF